MKNKAFLCAPRRFLIITVVYLLIQSVGIYLFFESLQYEEIGHLEAILNIIAPPAPLWIAAFLDCMRTKSYCGRCLPGKAIPMLI